jgi:energy-converting hydrogenase Eha subunit E
LDDVLRQRVHTKLYIEIAEYCRFEVLTCLKARPERRKKEVRRKLNRELTAIGYSPFFLTFSGRLYIKADDILVKHLKVSVLYS